MAHPLRRRSIASVAALALVASGLTLASLGSSPAGAASNGPTDYEVDCYSEFFGTAIPGPFLYTIDADVTPDPAVPSGDAMSVDGDITLTLNNSLIANFIILNEALVGPGGPQVFGVDDATINLSATNALAGTDTFQYNQAVWGTEDVIATGNAGIGVGTVTTGTTVTFATGTGPSPADLGKAITGVPAPLGPGTIPAGSVIIGVAVGVPAGFDTVTIVGVAPATPGAAEPMAWSGAVVLPQVGVNLGGYTTDGSNGQQTGVILDGDQSASQVIMSGALFSGGPLDFSTAGNPTTSIPCSRTFAPGGLLGPTGPPAPVDFAQADLVLDAVPQSASFNIGTSAVNAAVTLTATSDPATPVTSFQLVGLPGAGVLTDCAATPLAAGVPIAPTSTNTLAICYDAAATASIETFDFQVTDGVGALGAGGTGTITLQVGTPPVDQPLQVDVLGGALELSCANPTDPAVDCPLIVFPTVTLDGTNQTVNMPMNAIYVQDNRGDVTVGWELTSYVLPRLTNTTSTPFYGLLNDGVGGGGGTDQDLTANQIPAANVSLTGFTCTSIVGSGIPNAPGAGGAYGVWAAPVLPGTGQAGTQDLCGANAATSGGTFEITAGTFFLTVDADDAIGQYNGTVQYLVA